jgi:hypothetical protein
MWDFHVMSTMLESCIGLHCIFMFNITIYLILANVRKEFFPYLLGDKGYPLINWIMLSFKKMNNILSLNSFTIDNIKEVGL